MKKEFGIGDNAKYKITKQMALRGDLEELLTSISVLIAHLDNYMQIKLQCGEIMKDLVYMVDDLSNETETFDYRRIKLIENWISMLDVNIPINRKFYPLCNKLSSKSLTCSTLARKCERNYISYKEADECIYLNRIGDYFYFLTRYINQNSGLEDYL